MNRILVTAATGTIGSQVLDNLLAAGANVRVGVRDPDRFQPRGAEVVHLDFTDDASVAAALDGVSRALLFAPFTAEFHRIAAANIAAAAAAGLEHVVRISAIGARLDAAVNVIAWHGAADAALAASGLRYTILQPTFFQDNLLEFHGDSIRRDSAFYGASGGGRTAYVSSGDIARVAATVLLEPARHCGQTYVLTGHEPVTDAEVASTLERLLGRAVSYVDLAPEALRDGMLAAGSPPWLAEGLVGLEGVKASGYAEDVSAAVADITRRPPESLASFLARNAGALR